MRHPSLSEETIRLARLAFAGAMGRPAPGLASLGDPERLARMAAHHHVSPQVLAALVPMPARPDLEALKAQTKRDQTLAMSATGELIRLQQVLSAAGIPLMVLKGPPLSAMLYGNPFLRPIVDLDLLVDPADVGRAAGLLVRRGWMPWRPARVLEGRAARLFNWASKDWILVSPEGTVVEFHHRLVEDPGLMPADVRHLWAEGCWVGVSGQQFRVLSPSHNLCYLLLHAGSSGWKKLKWSLDIAVLLASADAPTVRALDAAVRETGLARIWNVGLVLMSDLYGLDLPEVTARARADRSASRLVRMGVGMLELTSGGQLRTARGVLLRMAQRACLVPGYRYKAAILAQRVGEPEFWPDLRLPDWAALAYPVMSPLVRVLRLNRNRPVPIPPKRAADPRDGTSRAAGVDQAGQRGV